MIKKNQTDSIESKFAPLSGAVFEQAQKRFFASGSSNICASDGIVFEISPDGKKKTIKEIDPPVSVDPETPIHIG